ncbi:MAG: aldo/keto reductase [Anaerolineae bacterium]
MEKRVLGSTGEHLSVVGFGGIVVRNETPESAKELVAEAIRRGINYFDVAPSYGNAEERLGPALEPYRDSVFLACKTEQRTRDDARVALHTSMEQLRTKRFDLYQLHGVTTMEEVDQILRPGGALEAFQEARDRGEIKYIGFSAHSEEAAIALMEGFRFDSILFPINYAAWYRGQFGPQVVQAAVDRGMGILALKALAKRSLAEGEARPWAKSWYVPVESYEEAKSGLRFTLSQPVTAAVSPGHAELLWWACDAAEEFTPLTPEEERTLAAESRDLTPVFPLA